MYYSAGSSKNQKVITRKCNLFTKKRIKEPADLIKISWLFAYENRKILGLSTDNITCSNVMDKKVNYKSCNIEFKDDHAYLDMKVNSFIFQYRYNCYGSKDDLKCDKIDKIKESI